MTLPLLLALCVGSPEAQAADPALPLRPITYPVDDFLSHGPIENFRELYVNSATFAKSVKPARAFPVKAKPKPKASRVKLVGSKIEISEKIFFVTGKADIDEKSHTLLDEIGKVLTDNPDITRMRIEGHTDSRGSAKANRNLSAARAEAVRAYLMGLEIDGARLVSLGHGEDKPLVDEQNEEAWSQNRRVEFHVVNRAPKPKVVAKPAPQPARIGMLPIKNYSSAWAEVAVNGERVGVIGPLTNGVIRDVPAGFYNVSFSSPNGFSWTGEVRTIETIAAIIPGSEEARVSVDEDVWPSWHDDPEAGFTGSPSDKDVSAGKKRGAKVAP